MQRRDFIRLAGHGPMLGIFASPLIARAVERPPTLLLVDRRFAETRALSAGARYADCRRINIDGDLVTLWNGPWRSCLAHGGNIAGLTTQRALSLLDSLTQEWGWSVLERRWLGEGSQALNSRFLHPQSLLEWRIGPG